ncbi:dynamin family protein [Haemophilus paraphrohaemolyticus]|uniref:Dynamin domain protein n=1 Tax=Haemophilus paraphrohaemolyticus HK411 TaxID=1095743 RepID=I2ND60_9PAST|nr:dynamin family protein [Haemophilus paraphrohaemolyticus]EIG23771.1 dynamin domain protein [Haemophilus paraphrohaemolyticus HK411]OOR94791.1 dynamin [Haemophilus paraphrohaemolyticus]STP01561.1 Predicted GTPase [Haemophilus paraphrohaemolyticus]
MQQSSLKQFFDELNLFANTMDKNHQKEGELKQKVEYIKNLLSNSSHFDNKALTNEHQLTALIAELTNSLKVKFTEWDKKIVAASPMQNLSKTFEDKIIFLVFGKVNAGKSSFSNQVVDLYRSLFPNDDIRRFALKDNKIVTIEGDFVEGFTETTAQIQGVELGKYFVLLDSPGLHSTEEKNGNLTKQFVDSADAVLWLTPSSSPGQVQELDELKYELEKGKPLLPIITRSDETEEDWDEVAQDIIAVVKDKTPDNRKLQEEDVYGRLEQKQKSEGAIKETRKPISISVYTFKSHQDLNKAGLARLFNEMAKLVTKATGYKGRKADKQIKNFINENVLSFLHGEIKTQISSISTQTANVLSKLEKDRKRITDLVESNAHKHTYEIVNKHRKSRNKNAIVQDINSLISQALGQEIAKCLDGFVSSLSQFSVQLDSSNIKDFEDRKISYQQERGAGKKSLAQAGGVAGGAAGAALGTAILPGVGTAIGGLAGGLIGGLLGGAAGSAMLDIETVTEVVGVDTEQMEKSLKAQISSSIKQTVDRQLDHIIAQIRPLQETCNGLESEVNKLIKEFQR